MSNDSELKVIVKAKELAVHTFKLTSNSNRYPKKYRHSLVDRMQLKSLDIYENLLEANRINNKVRKNERCEAITKAIPFQERCELSWISYIYDAGRQGDPEAEESKQEECSEEVSAHGEACRLRQTAWGEVQAVVRRVEESCVAR